MDEILGENIFAEGGFTSISPSDTKTTDIRGQGEAILGVIEALLGFEI